MQTYIVGPSDCVDVQTDEVRAARQCMIDDDTARSVAGIFRALGDPTRLRIISALAEREFCVGDLTAALDMAQPAVSHQLRDMRALHLVQVRKEGRHVYYRLDDEHVGDIFRQTLAHVRHSVSAHSESAHSESEHPWTK